MQGRRGRASRGHGQGKRPLVDAAARPGRAASREGGEGTILQQDRNDEPFRLVDFDLINSVRDHRDAFAARPRGEIAQRSERERDHRKGNGRDEDREDESPESHGAPPQLPVLSPRRGKSDGQIEEVRELLRSKEYAEAKPPTGDPDRSLL